MTPYIEAKKAEARERIVRCEQPPKDRGVLLSSPPQYRCERPGCRKTWVVGDTPPVCDMFDVEKHSDWLADTLLDEIESRVVPKMPMDEIYSTKPYGNSTVELVEKAKELAIIRGRLDAREEVKANFQHLRTGVETEV